MIRVIYEAKPQFPATDQHPDAERLELDVDGEHYWIDYIGAEPDEEDVRIVLSGKAA